MSDAQPAPVPGTLYKFTVSSAEEAAQIIRERLGEHARVLSVRNVEAGGLGRLFSKAKLEVVAQVDAAPAPARSAVVAQPALPATMRGPGAAAAVTAGGASSREPVEAEETFAPPAASLSALGAAPARGPIANHRSRIENGAPALPGLLRRAGFSETLLNRLEAQPAWRDTAHEPLHRGLVETGRILRGMAAARGEAEPLSRAAFIGTPGVGRTTALCKWLALEVFRRARIGHVVTAEFDRPHAPGPLPVFCEALGVPRVHFPASTFPATPGGFVYFDLPGISLRDPAENRALAAFLDEEKITQRVLVLNAAYDHAALRAAYAAGRGLGATHVVFTHLDEVPQWGRLWDYLLDGALRPLFLGTGPSLTGDCEEDAAEALARRTLPAAAAGADDHAALGAARNRTWAATADDLDDEAESEAAEARAAAHLHPTA